MDILIWLGLAAGLIGIAVAATAHVQPGLSLAKADATDSSFDGKMIGAAVVSFAAVAISAVVILKSSYSADDKKAAWACLTGVIGFWTGKSTS